MNELKSLYKSLSLRKRPEDIAALILQVLEGKLTDREHRMLRSVAKNSLKNKLFAYTSMLQEFSEPVGANKQINKAKEIFKEQSFNQVDYSDPAEVGLLVKSVSGTIQKEPGKNNYLADRLNKEARKAKGLDISKRQYNKRWRVLRHLEKKLNVLIWECKKFELQQTAKNGLARCIEEKDFMSNMSSACLIAYYTARCNLRSEFTIFGQQRPFDEVSNMLLKKCKAEQGANWWAVAHVYPDEKVLQELNDEQKGILLGKWTNILKELGEMLETVWKENQITRKTMVVKQGNDSSTWNTLAGAWNKARDHWMNLIYATGNDFILDSICFGKVMRLMAADVVAWHLSTGGKLDVNTIIWNELPLPWEVLSGEKTCTKQMVESVCRQEGVSPSKSGWIAPRKHGIAQYRPTPELVHGVAISNPFLARVLRKHKVFSGKTK